MTKHRRYRRLETKTRSYRKTRQTLLVFGTTGLLLGGGLTAVFIVKHNMLLVRIGLVYMLVAMLLLGLRGVLAYLDEQDKQRRAFNRIQRERSS